MSVFTLRFRSTLCGLLLGFASLPAGAALPAAVTSGGYELRMVGSGVLRFLGFSIYDASLWSSEGSFAGFEPGRPIALSLWYRRGFTRKELLDITSRAWRRLDTGSEEQRLGWISKLDTIWTDVAPGDNMTTVVVPGDETRFYDQNGLRGIIEDAAFGPAFLGIWLDHESVVGELRAELLGLE